MAGVSTPNTRQQPGKQMSSRLLNMKVRERYPDSRSQDQLRHVRPPRNPTRHVPSIKHTYLRANQ